MGSKALNIFQKRLDWPSPAEIAAPTGPGAEIYARLARRKVGQPLRLQSGGGGVRVGVLTKNPKAEDSEEPVGLLCQFSRTLTPGMLHEVQRLAWNFCRTPLLITVEKYLVRAWSCYETPNLDPTIQPLPIDEFDLRSANDIDRLIDVLHWIEIASGQFVARHPDRFQETNRADKSLLRNLSYIRKNLGLPADVTHDLLARLIFIQFLCHRKDKAGKPALNSRVFRSLHRRRVLRRPHLSLPEILASKTDTYSFFRWLNRIFNGDLFPAGLKAEKSIVQPEHLRMLANFVTGNIEMDDGQRCFWPLYSFDAIPLEFISSIYEEFVTKGENDDGIGDHYTPPHVVDFVLDRVLPWGGLEHELKILDPACGSAVFLVKAFQRLVNRWRNSNPNQEPSASVLRGFLENQLFGCDIEPKAIRVASFSLYLAMCDEIDPRHYWTQVKFPPLREVTLHHTDFFNDTIAGINPDKDGKSYDLVVGNAPWGENTVTLKAEAWAKKYQWKDAIPDEQVGPLFLPKAAQLIKDDGVVCMIQPAGSLLFNVSQPAKLFRRKLFEELSVEEIVNLSALRFSLFPNAVGPSCIVILSRNRGAEELISYWSPKPAYDAGMRESIVLEAHDLNWIRRAEAIADSLVWSALAWGSRRDLELAHRLTQNYDTLEKSTEEGTWRVARGFQRGVRIPQLPNNVPCHFFNIRGSHAAARFTSLLIDALQSKSNNGQRVGIVCLKSHRASINSLPQELRSRISTITVIGSADNSQLSSCDVIFVFCPVSPSSEMNDLPILERHRDWNDCPTVVQASQFDVNSDIYFEHSRELSNYKLPLLIMKESWSTNSFRFRSVVVTPSEKADVLLFSQSFYGVAGPTEEALGAIALILRSSLAVHFFYMTSGRLASYRPTIRQTDLVKVPIPKKTNVTFDMLASASEKTIDELAFDLFSLSKSERVLVEDFFSYTLEDFKMRRDSAGRQPIKKSERTSRLSTYCDWLIDTLKSGFGDKKAISSMVYTSSSEKSLPYCIVAIRLADGRAKREVQELSFEQSRKLVLDLSDKGAVGNIFYRRILRVYLSERLSDGTMIPTVYIIKPHEERYWTRSSAMRDTDEITADLMQSSLFKRKRQ